MKALWIKSLAVIGVVAIQSYSIVGIGVQWAPALGLEVKANKDTIAQGASRSILLDEKGVTGLQGFGAKLWIDALPFVDLQLSGNMQFGYYDADLILPDTTVAINYKLPIPFLQGKPYFARVFGDAAVLYPFLKFPPLIPLVKVYGGGGITYGVATQILSASLAKKAFANSNLNADSSTAAQITPVLVKAIKNEGLTTGMGGFVQLGSQFKVPVVPIAVYLDFKYHFLSFSPDLVSSNGLTMELGAALAF